MYELCPTPFNLTDYVLTAGQSTPDKVALQVVGGTNKAMSHAVLRQAILGTATGLIRAGLSSGDRVMLRLGNTPDFPICFLGAIAAGIIPIPTSAQLTLSEATKLAALCKPNAIVAAPDVPLPDHPAKLVDLDTLQSFQTLPPATPIMGDPNRPAYIIFTSGTSGSPRGVVHAHRAIWARRMMWDGWYGLTQDDRMMHAGAFNWTYTLGTGLLDPWTIGATALIPASGIPASQLPHLIEAHRATLFAAVPGIYRQILRHPLRPMPSLRHGLSAGEKLPDNLRTTWTEQTGSQIHEAFGMSECSTFVSGSPASPAPSGTLGFAQPGRRVALRGGQIAVHASDPGLMLGYLDDPQSTAAKYDGDWFLTGDLAEQTHDAYSYLGRADDMMNAGGFRVSPLEVEAAMTLHQNVYDAATCEVRAGPDKTLIAAFYTGAATSDAELHSHCAAHLAKYKCPHLFMRLDTLPRGANNKLQRRQLRTQWETDNGQT